MDALEERIVSHPTFTDTITRSVQSVKDKRFAEMERVKTYLEKFGGDAKEAARQMKIDDILERDGAQLSTRDAGASRAEDTADAQKKKVQSEVGELLVDAGISTTDADVVALSQRSYPSWDAYKGAVSKMIARRHKALAPATGASVVQEGGTTPAATDKTEKIAQLEARLRELQKRPTSPEYKQVLSELQALGW